jgi:hypothetical protein
MSRSDVDAVGNWETAGDVAEPSVSSLRCRDQIRAVPLVRITTARLVD